MLEREAHLHALHRERKEKASGKRVEKAHKSLAHRKKEDEKSQMEIWSQTQTVGVADAKTQRKKEAKKSQVET